MNHTEHKEELALKIGNNRAKLLKRLKDALSSMNSEGRKVFNGATFDFENKRLVSACKCYALQWAIRRFPDKPEAPDNQQTTLGTVFVMFLTEKKKNKKRTPKSRRKYIKW